MELSNLIREAESDGVHFRVVNDQLRIGTTERNEHWLEELEPFRPDILSLKIGAPATHSRHTAEITESVAVATPPLPKFPTDTLPGVMGEWVEGEAHATQTVPDLAALCAISVCSSRLARRVVVCPRDGWNEPTNIYTAALLDPANRKSVVFANALDPLLELERELIEAARPEVAKLQSRRRQADARLKKLERKLAESGEDDPEARHEADMIAEQLANEVEAVLPRLRVDGVTGEKLAMILAEQQGRIFSASAAVNVFDLMAGQYSKNNSNSFEVYLKGHAGDDFVQDRVSRESVRIEKPAITCCYAMQPEVLRCIAKNSAFRGRGLFEGVFEMLS